MLRCSLRRPAVECRLPERRRDINNSMTEFRHVTQPARPAARRSAHRADTSAVHHAARTKLLVIGATPITTRRIGVVAGGTFDGGVILRELVWCQCAQRPEQPEVQENPCSERGVSSRH
jgi:hypothetical protein